METDELLNQAIDIYMSSLKGLEHFVSQPAARYALSFEQYLILQEVVKSPGIKLMDIAAKRQVTRSAVSRQLRVLIKNDYIKQEPDQADRRKVSLVATPAGQTVARKIKQRISDRFAKWVAVFGEDRGRQLLQLWDEFNHQIIQPENNDKRKGEEQND
ncbi:MAG TPA: MarR family winged helix-turn-helix transcriptional regulator [Candidatus Limosilactobacillus intestinigallinarum]|nr:MarR family winged helix-turn-helix transcriptional regulator [Candidatus Limosilactobacillus intestinigallinarum]